MPRRLSGTHFPRLSSEATHRLYSNLGYKHSYFLGTLASTHNRLPKAPLKLRPYGAIQICFLLLLLLLLLNKKRFHLATNACWLVRRSGNGISHISKV